MKYILTLCFLFNSLSATALESASNIGSSQGSLDNVKVKISEITSEIAAIEDQINQMKACGDNNPPQFFDGSSCVNAIENDPLTAAQGKANIATCTNANEAQYFNGTTWTCKAF